MVIKSKEVNKYKILRKGYWGAILEILINNDARVLIDGNFLKIKEPNVSNRLESLFINNGTFTVKWKCEKIQNYRQFSTFYGCKCKICGNRKSNVTTDKIKQEKQDKFFKELKDKDYTLINGKVYHNINSKVDLRCNKCGREYLDITPKQFFAKKSCNGCNIKFNRFTKTIQNIKEEVSKRKGYLPLESLKQLEDSSYPSHENIKVYCKRGHPFYPNQAGHLIRKNKQWCDKCHFKARTASSWKVIVKFVKQMGGELVFPKRFEEYNGTKQQIYIKCGNCNETFKKLGSSLSSNINSYWCPYCADGCAGEKLLKKFVELIYEVEFKKDRPEWNKSPNTTKRGKRPPLELDLYNEELGIAFEYDGVQHDKPIKMFGGLDAFKSITERDNQKNKNCMDNKINLYRIKEIKLKDSKVIKLMKPLQIYEFFISEFERNKVNIEPNKYESIREEFFQFCIDFIRYKKL